MVITEYDLNKYNLIASNLKEGMSTYQKKFRYLFYFYFVVCIVFFLTQPENFLFYFILMTAMSISFILIILLFCRLIFFNKEIAINYLKLQHIKKVVSKSFHLKITHEGEITYTLKNNTTKITSISSYYQSDNFLIIKSSNASIIKIPIFIKDFENFKSTLTSTINNNQITHNILKKALSNYLDNKNYTYLFSQISNLDYLVPYTELNTLENPTILIDPITKKELIIETIEEENEHYICAYSNTQELNNNNYSFIKKVNFKTLFELASDTEIKSVLFNNQQKYGILINKNSDKIYIKPIKED